MSIARALAGSDLGVISFTVHEPPNPPLDRLDRAESMVFVKDGFTYAAAMFAPLWLLAKRQWLALLAYLVVCVAAVFAVALLDGPAYWLSIMSAALHLLIGFEADSIQRFTLARRGYRMVGSVSGRSESECERRFFESWLPQQPGLLARMSAAATGQPIEAHSGDAPGMAGLAPAAPPRRGLLGLLRRRR